MNETLIAACISFLAVALLIPIARSLALKFNLVDHPGGRKQHQEPIPPIGGLVIFPVFIGALLLSGQNTYPVLPFVAALILLLGIGAWDDKHTVRPKYKLLAQFIAAVIIIFVGNTVVLGLGDLLGLGHVFLGPFRVLFSTLAIMLLINAINLIDGLDGLAGGLSVTSLFWLVIGSFASGGLPATGGAIILIGATLGFLVHNMRFPWQKHAKVFLGDAGSLALGLAISWYAIQFSYHFNQHILPISVAWILALPIMDTCAQFLRRALNGQYPFSPDRHHFHHHFVDTGVPAGKATMIILSINALYGFIGILPMFTNMPQYILTIGWIGLFALHMFLSLRPERMHNLIEKVFGHGPRK